MSAPASGMPSAISRVREKAEDRMLTRAAQYGPRLAVMIFAGTSLMAAELPYFSVLHEDPGAWPEILSSIGFEPRPAASSHVFVARSGSPASPEWPARIERGAILIVEGESSLAA